MDASILLGQVDFTETESGKSPLATARGVHILGRLLHAGQRGD